MRHSCNTLNRVSPLLVLLRPQRVKIITVLLKVFPEPLVFVVDGILADLGDTIHGQHHSLLRQRVLTIAM
jgi:hypothetical protein